MDKTENMENDMWKIYSIPEIITFLKQKEFENFDISEKKASIFMQENATLVLEAFDGNVKEENIALAIEVLNNLDECVKKAQPWLGHFNLKHDKWYPDALGAGYEISGIYVGTWYHGAPFSTTTDGFTISFSTINYYPEQFTVKYTKRLWPIAVEEWVE